jgi:hypothetical protein
MLLLCCTCMVAKGQQLSADDKKIVDTTRSSVPSNLILGRFLFRYFLKRVLRIENLYKVPPSR